MEVVSLAGRVQSRTSLLLRCYELLLSAFRSIRIRRREHSLRLCETLPLGEKRLLAVVQFERQRFLIGSTGHSISLLQRLDDSPSFSAEEANLSGALDTKDRQACD